MIAITLKDVKFHFNKDAILTPAQKFQKRLLNKFGATVRATQRNSMKRGKPGQASHPGNPPLRHSSRPDIKETVFYFVDVNKKDVVIGMVLLAQGSATNPMPGVLEHSGTSIMRSRKGRTERRKKAVHIEARPSAVPAFKKTIEKQLPGLIAGGIMREV